jgi:hypothetical protein
LAATLLANALPADDNLLARTSQKPAIGSSIIRGKSMSFAIPANESGRLEALRRYAILNTVPEVGYDEITELAAQICGCPVAVIGFVDEAQAMKDFDAPLRELGLDPEGTQETKTRAALRHLAGA